MFKLKRYTGEHIQPLVMIRVNMLTHTYKDNKTAPSKRNKYQLKGRLDGIKSKTAEFDFLKSFAFVSK